jgi:RND family efflux transporter MFP subunit
MKYIKLIFVFGVALLMQFCGTDNHTHGPADGQDTAHQDHAAMDEAPSVVGLSEAQIKAIDLKLGVIEKKQLNVTLKANGNLKVPNNNKGNATSMYAGVIKSIQIETGSFVKKGQTLATIASPQFIQIQEEYLSISNKIIFGEQELDRQKALNEGNAGALKNLQAAVSELNNLKVKKSALRQQLMLMGIDSDGLTAENMKSSIAVKSPLTGTISQIFSKIGSYVDVSAPLAEIVNNDALHLDLYIFEKDLPHIKVGQTIHFTLTNNPVQDYIARVYSIGTAFENESKTIQVHCYVNGNKTGLIDGMNITAMVSLDNISVPAVPNGAILDTEGKSFIYIETKKQTHEAQDTAHPIAMKFEKTEIVKGVSSLGFTGITLLNDLPQNTKIVTKGAFFINAKMTNSGEAHEH